MYSKHNHQHHKPSHPDLVIKVDWNKKMLDVPKQYRILGVEGDSNSRSFPFEILRAPTDIDFTTGVIKVAYINANGEADEHVIEQAVVEDNKISFDFVVPPKLTVKSGRVRLGLCIMDNIYEWHISPTEFYVMKYGDFSTPVETLPEYDLLNQILLKQTFLQKYIDDGNNVDLDGLLEIFNSKKLGFEYVAELPQETDVKTETIYAMPSYIEEIDPVTGELSFVLAGYDTYVWNGEGYVMVAQTPTLSTHEFEEDEIEAIWNAS